MGDEEAIGLGGPSLHSSCFARVCSDVVRLDAAALRETGDAEACSELSPEARYLICAARLDKYMMTSAGCRAPVSSTLAADAYRTNMCIPSTI